MTKLTMFSWGYHGWGSSTSQLKRAFDAVEIGRGYAAPYFVDIRIHRRVRAEGFKNDAFEKVVGSARYCWLGSLGNKAAKDGSKAGTEIKDPSAAEELLGLALTRASRSQRVIFFCSCQYPVCEGRRCHRVEVGSLLLKTARRRNVDLTIVEWPGGLSKTTRMNIRDPEFMRLRADARNFVLGTRLPSLELLSLAWDSIVQFRSKRGSLAALADHARFRGGRWLLPLPHGVDEGLAIQALQTKARGDRRKHGFEPRTTQSS